MNISSAQTRSLTEITAAFDESGVGADKEVSTSGNWGTAKSTGWMT